MRHVRENKQKRPTWLDSILGIVGMAAAFPAVIYIHEQFSAWALIIAWVAVAVSIIVDYGSFVGWAPSWLDIIIRAFGYSMCLFLAVRQDWFSVRLAMLSSLKLALFLGSLALLWILARQGKRASIHVTIPSRDESDKSHPFAQFRDDGERIVVHADRQHLGALTFVLVLVMIGLVWGLFYGIPRYTGDAAGSFLLLIGVVFLGLFTIVTAICLGRLVLSLPTLIVGPEGVLDNASRFVTGSGLIRWDEIGAIQQKTQKNSSGAAEYVLSIGLVGAGLTYIGQPWWKRELDLTFRLTPLSALTIDHTLLDRPPDVLAAEIKCYVAEHAPKGWQSPLIERVDEGEDEPTPAD